MEQCTANVCCVTAVLAGFQSLHRVALVADIFVDSVEDIQQVATEAAGL